MNVIIWVSVSTKAQDSKDKDSLASQERDAIAHCQRSNWTIIDILRVPGHSRNYLDFHELASDARLEGITAFDHLMTYIQNQNFDVLVVRDGDRFARTQTLHAFITESIIKSGATIYSLADGEIGKHNYRMWTAMSGYKSASEIDSLTKKRKFGMLNRAKRGLNTGSRMIRSHQVIRDDLGKASHIEVNPDTQVEIIRAVQLLLDGDATLSTIDAEMQSRYGYRPSKKNPNNNYYYRLFNNPVFWGHTGMRYTKYKGLFKIEQGHPIPDDVEIFYHTHEPALRNPLHDEFLAYLRINNGNRGKANHLKSKYRYSGLIICGECGRYRSYDARQYVKTGERRYLRCFRARSGCQQERTPESDYDEIIHNELIRLTQTGDISQFQTQTTTPTLDLSMIDDEISKLQIKLNNLITQQSQFEGTASLAYADVIKATADQIDKLIHERQTYQNQQYRIHAQYQDSIHAVHDLKALTIEQFWQLSLIKQNRLLHRLMGDIRFVALDHQIIGRQLKPKNSRQYK